MATEVQWPGPEKPYPPLWLAFPRIPRDSIGWQTGAGESYSQDYSNWYDTLSDSEKETYNKMFPAPIEFANPDSAFKKNDLMVYMWHPSGKPKYDREWAAKHWKPGSGPSLLMFYQHAPVLPDRITEVCLSQWYPSKFHDLGHDFTCGEQYMMVQKAGLFGDDEIRKAILAEKYPGQMLALGRSVSGFKQAEWNQLKYTIVLNGNWRKFSQNQELKQYLLSTGDSILVSAAANDDIWGIGYSEDHPNAWDPKKWRGQNLLGFALMEVRDALRDVCRYEHLCDWKVLHGE